MVISTIIISLLFSSGFAQQKQSESYDQAIYEYTKAIELNPNSAEAYNKRGVAYGKKGQYDQAISDFTKALEINPKDAEAYNNRGIAYYFKREYEKSWEDIKKAQEFGYKIPPDFLDDLRKASGREK
jgi:tetratricopeptide (TPR) repeat protein